MGEPSLEKAVTEIATPSSLPAEFESLERAPVSSPADSAIAVAETVICDEADVPTKNEKCLPASGSSVLDPAAGLADVEMAICNEADVPPAIDMVQGPAASVTSVEMSICDQVDAPPVCDSANTPADTTAISDQVDATPVSELAQGPADNAVACDQVDATPPASESAPDLADSAMTCDKVDVSPACDSVPEIKSPNLDLPPGRLPEETPVNKSLVESETEDPKQSE